ncbi:hypothetical protein AbraIFM66951_003979 [Aspergillus brasiliensis]|nr:hypothetical protein AbraIFM66951_003979 [Aspergillus brasiliensis]
MREPNRHTRCFSTQYLEEERAEQPIFLVRCGWEARRPLAALRGGDVSGPLSLSRYMPREFGRTMKQQLAETNRFNIQTRVPGNVIAILDPSQPLATGALVGAQNDRDFVKSTHSVTSSLSCIQLMHSLAKETGDAN